MFHTGGTTSLPKIVRHTHRMQASQLWITGVSMGYRGSDVVLAGAPLFHVGGAIVGGVVPLSHGATILIMSPAGFRDTATRQNVWTAVAEHRVTSFIAVPTVLSALLSVPINGQDISSLRFVASGGSPVPLKVVKSFERIVNCRVYPGFGMTETVSYVVYPPRDGEWPDAAAGLAMPHIELRVVKIGPDGEPERECAVNEIGSLLIRGPVVTPGYVHPEHNAGSILRGSWLNSGDLARVDASGMVFLTGRAKDLIIRGAHNIDPLLIEDILYGHPAVQLAAAVGRPDAYAGELPMAYVQLRAGQTASEDELKTFVRQRIAERAANPVAIVQISAMPQTIFGKIFKPLLRQDAIRRAYEEQIEPIARSRGFSFSVDVRNDEVSCMRAIVRLERSAMLSEVSTEIAARLDRFVVPYLIQDWDAPAIEGSAGEEADPARLPDEDKPIVCVPTGP